MSEEDQMKVLQHFIGQIALAQSLAATAHDYIMTNLKPEDRVVYAQRLTDQYAKSILEVASMGVKDLAFQPLKVAEMQAYFDQYFADILGKSKGSSSSDKPQE